MIRVLTDKKTFYFRYRYMSSFVYIKSHVCTHRSVVLHRTFLGASKHGAMFADVRQHFILSSARDPKRRAAQKISLRLASMHSYTYVYLSGPMCSHKTCEMGARVHPHKVKELLSGPIRIKRKRTEIASERANIDGS